MHIIYTYNSYLMIVKKKKKKNDCNIFFYRYVYIYVYINHCNTSIISLGVVL